MTKRRTSHYYTNIVAQLIQSRSHMSWHLLEKTLILRFDLNCAHVTFETIKQKRKNPKCLMLSVNNSK